MPRIRSVGSVCSGAGFMDLGFDRAGLKPAWFCEADAYRRRVLARHWPGVPIHADLTELDPADLEPVDVYAGGTPCPDWSIAGNRAGFEGDRASLYWHFIRIRDAIKPEWTVWENVPGVFSQHEGRDFARVLGALVGTDIAVPSGGWTGGGCGCWTQRLCGLADAQRSMVRSAPAAPSGVRCR